MGIVIGEFSNQFDRLKESPDYGLGLGQELVAEILSLPPKQRFAQEPLLRIIDEDAFARGINIPNLDLAAFVREKDQWIAAGQRAAKQAPPVVVDDFDPTLFHISAKYQSLFAKVKGSFIFKLRNPENSKTKTVFVCDDGCLSHPDVQSFDGDDETCQISKMKLTEFADTLRDEVDSRTWNYLVIALVTPTLHIKEGEIGVEGKIEEFAGYFSEAKFIEPRTYPIQGPTDYELKPIENGYKSLRNFSDKVFNNRDLSFGDEQVIKKMFVGSEIILNYRFLKRGNTGAKVIEIQPLRPWGGDMARFVVKYGELSHDGKIQDEHIRFRKYIEDYAEAKYSANYESTGTHEGIKYGYASHDGKSDSISFSTLVDDLVRGDKAPKFPPSSTIRELFAGGLFPHWLKTQRPVTKKVRDLYVDYLNKEEKVIETIATVLNQDIVEIEASNLIKNYRFITDQSISTLEKVCHGDLHSENFFKDESGVYLIDFGWTGPKHALIDHATLECSLKFKHIPVFVPRSYSTKCEGDHLMGINSFYAGMDLSAIDRPAVREVFELIHAIRADAIGHALDKGNPLEYLIAVYVLSFRQILYGDLNQRYALASTSLLGDAIVNLLSDS